MWSNPQETADLVTFTEEILNGNFYFLCCVRCKWTLKMSYLLMTEKSFESFLIYQVLRCHLKILKDTLKRDNQTLLLQKYRWTSPSIFYDLKIYDTH